MKIRNKRFKSASQHRFSEVPTVSIPRSSFNLKHKHMTTFDVGDLIPFYVDEVLPGDSFKVKTNIFARVATLIAPIMDNLYLDTFYFFVPNRLLWDNWKKFMGEQTDPGDSTDYLVPQSEAPTGGFTEGSLYDHMGLPTQLAGIKANSLHFRAYNLIWNEWFRDQNLQDSLTVDTDDGPDTPGDYLIRKRGKRHDYFTSCLPWPQKGDEVSIPLGDTAPVIGIGKINQSWGAAAGTVYETGGAASTSYASARTIGASLGANNSFTVEEDPDNAGYPNIRADLADATAATINSLRLAFQVQRMLEKDARGGTRYIEIIKSHFNVTSPDARLQRPEYLGGSTAPLLLDVVPQTSESGSTPQANLASAGTVNSRSFFSKSFTEHGVILGLMAARADLTYQQGINRMWSRQTRYDYYWPSLAHLGEQAVLNKEIYAQATSADDGVFGYQERYAEYRYKPSLVTGAFRANAAAPLTQYHLAYDFSSLPVLDSDFIEEDPPIDNVIAVPSEPHFIADIFINAIAARPMPVFSIPGKIDHF